MLTDSQRAALALRLRQGRVASTGEIPRRRAGAPPPPASFGQEQLWFVDRFAPGLPTYNVPYTLRLGGELDIPALERAVGGLTGRHDALRTRLVTDDSGRPVQAIDPPGRPVLDVVDLSGFEAGKRGARLRELLEVEAMRPFDLAAGPLMRTSLIRLSETEHVLASVFHHAVFDGWSSGVFVRDLAALYGSEVTGEPSGLPELPVQFADYAVWERRRLQGPVLAELESYWRDVLAGAETVEFPTDRPRPAMDSFEGAVAGRMADGVLLEGLREVSRREGVTPFATLLAGLLVLLQRYTGQDDLVVGTVSANRGRSVLGPLIGFLVNTLPIRTDLSGDPSFRDVLSRVKQAVMGAFAHQDLPFGKLVDILNVERDVSRSPVFQIGFSYAEQDDAPVPAAGVEFAESDLMHGIDAAKFDLAFAVETRREGLWIECSYKTVLFDAGTLERLLEHLEVLLRGVVANRSARLSELPLLTAAELDAERRGWNDTEAPVPPGCAHELFEAQAVRTPAAVAASFQGSLISYASLNLEANQIARRLRSEGIGPEGLVGICMRSGLRRLAALLGVWKAGGGYVPLDPSLPAERLEFMIADTAMTVILTDAASHPSIPAVSTVTVAELDGEWEQFSGLDGANLDGSGVEPANVAYVRYTSGSTGHPKGVVLEHRNLVNLLHGMVEHWQIGPRDAVLQFASLAFDASVIGLVMPLAAGARTVLASAETLDSPPRLAALLRDEHVTFACLPPAVLGALPDGDYPDLSTLMTLGAELPSELARHWIRPDLRLLNGYGLTETTALATYAELHQGTSVPAPIGLPVRPNYQAYVLDPKLNPVPAGVVGELYIGGASVARGYLNRPELSRERFIPDPFRDAPGGRLCKTGDLARRRPDGSIVFAGRIDRQVRIRGLRIELGKIETVLTSHPAIAQAILTVVTSPAGDKELAAYLRPAPGGGTFDAEEVRAHLARTLAATMIPAHLIAVGEFPLNPSGEVDKLALPPPHWEVAAYRPGPETPAETMLASLYAGLLGTGPVGATESFFDLGGNSLSAMRLVDMISRETGADLGVSVVFLNPTPRRLAAAIEAAGRVGPGAGPAQAGSIVALTEGGTEPPLFLIHAIGGTVSAYAGLGRELTGAFTVYGLESPGLTDSGAVRSSLTGLVADYTQRIRAVQPAGPYRLAGWSMGGVVAFEVARRLEQAGAEVGLLVLLDAPFALPADEGADDAELAGSFVADATRSLGLDPADVPEPAVVSAAGQLAWLADRLAGGASPAGRASIGTGLERRFRLFTAHSRMLAGYRPSFPAVRAPALIVSAANSPNAPAAALWQSLLSRSGPVSVLQVDSDHYAFLRSPLVTGIGAAIREFTVDEHGLSDAGAGFS